MANRTIVMPGVWANDAQTAIPTPPVSNTSYRNSNLTEQTINDGWGYSTIVNSADYNQFMYLLTQFLKTVEDSGGVLPFCMATTYNKNGYAIGSNGLLYISQKGDNIGNDPTEDDGTNWKTFAQIYLSNFVTLNTPQTITGQKVFTTQLMKKSTDIDVTSKATSGTYNTLVRFRDKNNKELGAVNNAQMNGGNIRTVLEAKNKDNYVPSIGVQAPYEGSTGGYGFAPNTPDNAPANAIVTKDKIANMVTTDTAQTITGFKAFNNGSGNNRTNIDIITNDGVGDDTNVKWAGSIRFKKGNVDVGSCEAMRDSANSSIAQITAHNSVNGQEVYAVLRSVVTSDGNAFAMAPTPSIGVTGEEITTAGWFNSKMQVVSALPAEPDPNVFYFIPE